MAKFALHPIEIAPEAAEPLPALAHAPREALMAAPTLGRVAPARRQGV